MLSVGTMAGWNSPTPFVGGHVENGREAKSEANRALFHIVDLHRVFAPARWRGTKTDAADGACARTSVSTAVATRANMSRTNSQQSVIGMVA